MKSLITKSYIAALFLLLVTSENVLRADTFVILARNLDGSAIGADENVQVRAFRLNQGTTLIPSGPPFDLRLLVTNPIRIDVTKIPNPKEDLQLTFSIDANSPDIARDEGSNRSFLLEFQRDGVTTAVVPFFVVGDGSTQTTNQIALAIPTVAQAAEPEAPCPQRCVPRRRLLNCLRWCR